MTDVKITLAKSSFYANLKQQKRGGNDIHHYVKSVKAFKTFLILHTEFRRNNAELV